MSSLQSGINSSQLTPQAFKNSTQSGTVQGTLNRSLLEQSSGNYLKIEAPAGSQLKVTESINGTQTTLGVSSVSPGANQAPVTSQSDGGINPIIFILFVIMGVLAYMLYRLRKSMITESGQEDK